MVPEIEKVDIGSMSDLLTVCPTKVRRTMRVESKEDFSSLALILRLSILIEEDSSEWI